MSDRWTARDLHVELAYFYNQYRGLPAPRNRFTEDLWARIELAEKTNRVDR